VSISDLLSAGLIEPGAVMRSTWSSLENRYATVLADGNIETDDGVIFNSLSGSGRHVAATNSVGGWRFWSIGEGENARLLSEIRNEYRDRFEIDADTTEESEESEE
jgi:hypothetical protein